MCVPPLVRLACGVTSVSEARGAKWAESDELFSLEVQGERPQRRTVGSRRRRIALAAIGASLARINTSVEGCVRGKNPIFAQTFSRTSTCREKHCLSRCGIMPLACSRPHEQHCRETEGRSGPRPMETAFRLAPLLFDTEYATLTLSRRSFGLGDVNVKDFRDDPRGILRASRTASRVVIASMTSGQRDRRGRSEILKI
jgi:hypothetical protein